MRIVDPGNEPYKTIAKQFPYFFYESYAKFERSLGSEYFVICDEEETYIPLKISKRFIFRIGVFMHSPLNILKQLTAEQEKSFLIKACEFAAQQCNCIRIEHGLAMSVFQSYPEDAKFSEIGLFVIDLTKSEEEIFAAFDPAYRKQIRNAEKNGIEVRQGKEELENFYKCYAETHDRQNIAHENLNFFGQLFTFLGEDAILCVNDYCNNILEASLYMIVTDYAVYCLYGGSASETQLKGSAKKIHWECIKMAKAKGAKRFVFGGERRKNVEGTKFEGIQNFKRRFGTDVINGFIWKTDLNKFMCVLYDTLFWIRCKMRGTKIPRDIIDSQSE